MYLRTANFGPQPANFGPQPANYGPQPANFGSQPANFGPQPANFSPQPANLARKPAARKIAGPSDATLMLVSSANIRGVATDKQFGKSLIYIKNSSGPRLLPCGIPNFTSHGEDKHPITLHCCNRLLRYELNHAIDLTSY